MYPSARASHPTTPSYTIPQHTQLYSANAVVDSVDDVVGTATITPSTGALSDYQSFGPTDPDAIKWDGILGVVAVSFDPNLDIGHSDIKNKLYVTGVGFITLCDIVAVTGALANCVQIQAPIPADVRNITVQKSRAKAYIANLGGGGGGGNVVRCVVTLSGVDAGTLSSCAEFLVPPLDVYWVHVHNDFLYLSLGNSDSVQVCTFNVDGDEPVCEDSGATGLENPRQIVTRGTHFWVASPGNGRVVHCTIDPTTGKLGSCDFSVRGCVGCLVGWLFLRRFPCC